MDRFDKTLADLDQQRDDSRYEDRSFTVAWALEHTATHVGHAQITRELWDKQHS